MTAPDLTLEELPTWMRPRRRVIDWGLLVILGFCLVLSVPLLARPGLPQNTNAELYEYRSIEVTRIVQSGTLYSRWAPDLHYALGSPLFNYLAPLPHYLAGYYEALTDNGPINSIKLLLVVSILAAGSGMYLFARQRWGASAGTLAALAYLFSTPIAFALPYICGDLGLMLALGLLPWVVYALDNLWLFPRRRKVWSTAMLLILFILSDTQIAFLGGIVIIVAAISLRWRPEFPIRTFRNVLVVIGCALAITAFYWLPAIAERDQIQWIATGNDPQAGSVLLSEIFAPLPRYDLRMQNPPLPHAIGAGVGLLALIGGAALVIKAIRRDPTVRDGLLFLTIGLILVVIATPAFSSLWPSAASFQPLLPYHAILVATFCLAAVAGQAARWFKNSTQSVYWITALAVCITAAALPTVYPPEWPAPSHEPDMLASLGDELAGYHLGTFRSGILLSAGITKIPEPALGLLNSLQVNTFQRLNSRLYSPNMEVNTIEQGLLNRRYYLKVNQTVDIEYYTLNYPGWTASIDGNRQPLQSSAQGLIKVTVPQGASDLDLWLEGTPIRVLAWAITWISLSILILLRRQSSVLGSRISQTIPLVSTPNPSSSRLAVGVAVALILYAIAGLMLSQHPDLLFSRSSQGVISGTTTLPPDSTDHTVALSGYTLEKTTLQPGESLNGVFYWQAAAPLTNDYQSEIQLVDNQQVVAWTAHRQPGSVPTSRWLPDRYIRDSFSLMLPTTLKSGDYTLQAKINACEAKQLAPCNNPARIDTQQGSGFAESLTTIHVTAP
ncbi:MAG: 6-pyruvoyl-tetrahydropterin synthase-related protein [Chloroflexota bacterium]